MATDDACVAGGGEEVFAAGLGPREWKIKRNSVND